MSFEKIVKNAAKWQDVMQKFDLSKKQKALRILGSNTDMKFVQDTNFRNNLQHRRRMGDDDPRKMHCWDNAAPDTIYGFDATLPVLF